MVNIITRDTNSLVEYEVHKFSAEASDIGLRPGEWPSMFQTTMGNLQPLIAVRREERDGDLLWVDYLQGNGCMQFRVYND